MKHFQFFVFLCFLTFSVSCGQQKKYIQYKVKEGETMRNIAKKLDMKTKDLLRLNPDVDRRPVANTVIVIPNKQFKSVVDTKNEGTLDEVKKGDGKKTDEVKEDEEEALAEIKKNFVVYEVKKGDTFYSLTRFYNVTQSNLVALNPELSEGLKTGQIIKIKAIKNETESEVTIYEDVIEEDVSLKVALLLPFLTKENDTLEAEELFPRSRLANIVTDFYLGSEIAIDSLRKQGVQIQLNVYDTGRNSTKLDSIVKSTNLDDNDVIIGPLYSEETQFLAKKVSTPIVFPVYSKNQSKFSSSKLIKTSPEKIVFKEELITFLKDSLTNQNMIVVGDGKSASNISVNSIKQSLESHDSVSIVHVVKPKDGYIPRERFTTVFKNDTKNWILMATDNNVIVSDAINSVNSLADSLQMRVFAYNKSRAYDKVDNLKLARVGFTYVSDQYVDEDSPITKAFNAQYMHKNKALPSFYATKGFDITYDILMRLASGNSLKSTFKDGASYRIESKYDYTTKLFGITENKGLFIVKYNKDLSLTRLK